MTCVESCDFATERTTVQPDVEIVSQHLMEENRPAGNDSQPGCLLQGANTKLLVCKGGNTHVHLTVGRLHNHFFRHILFYLFLKECRIIIIRNGNLKLAHRQYKTS